jgi:hypothetical protein
LLTRIAEPPATLAANVAHGLGHGPVGAAVAAWPAIALVGSYELFMTIIRGTRQPDDRVSGAEHVFEAVSGTDPLRVQAVEVFADDVAAGRLLSIRAIRLRLRVGQSRAQQVWAGNQHQALTALWQARQAAPQHTRCNPAVIETIAVLIRGCRKPSPPLIHLATWIGHP